MRIIFLSLFLSTQAWAFDYQLKAQQINDSTYVVMGVQEDFSPGNGGALANISFVVTDLSVVLIDAGPSKIFGEQLRKLIKGITPKPISHLILTHAHPDHFLALEAFPEATVLATASTRQQIEQEGGDYNLNMYRLVQGAMKGTSVKVPPLASLPAHLEIGKHRFKLIALTGHSKADLVVHHENSDTLFTGDLVFNERTPTTPHADLPRWQESLKQLNALKFKQLVPGHGPIGKDSKAIFFTSAYLTWLDNTLSQAAFAGKDPAEILTTKAPVALGQLAVFQAEFARSVAHLYPKYEQATFK